jgi:hypothetical protein
VSILGARGDLAAAETHLREAFESTANHKNVSASARRTLAQRLAQLYESRGQPNEAAAWTARAAQIVD